MSSPKTDFPSHTHTLIYIDLVLKPRQRLESRRPHELGDPGADHVYLADAS
jgi:hypothetical protein